MQTEAVRHFRLSPEDVKHGAAKSGPRELLTGTHFSLMIQQKRAAKSGVNTHTQINT